MIGEGDIVIVHAVQVVVRVIEENKRSYTREIGKFQKFEDMVDYASDIFGDDVEISLRLHDHNMIITKEIITKEMWSNVGWYASIWLTGKACNQDAKH